MRHLEYLQQSAVSRRFSLGTPHTFTVRPDGSRVYFLRSLAFDDPMTCLWSLDVESGEELLLVDARQLLAEVAPELTAQSRVERERGGATAGAKVAGDGIASYAVDAAVRRACFAVAEALWVVELEPGAAPRRIAEGSVQDPRLDPLGRRVAFVEDGSLCEVDLVDGTRRGILTSDDPEVSYGLPEYVAADFGRRRGYWWSPDGSLLVVARVDNRAVQRWHISNPAEPEKPPAVFVRPMVGAANADVTLSVVGDGRDGVAVEWDRGRFEYLINCSWSEGGLLFSVQSRDQRSLEVHQVDPVTGETVIRHRASDPSWVTTIAGLPSLLSTGELLRTGIQHDTHMLFVDDEPVTPAGLQVLEAYGLNDDALLFAATYDSTETHIWSYARTDGLSRLSEDPGVHSGAGNAATAVVGRQALELERAVFEVRRRGAPIARIATASQPAGLTLRLELLLTGADDVRTALLLPDWHKAGDPPLPVLLDPYGGLALRKVLNARTADLLDSQWFADQGFAVIVADGHGTPGRAPAWERAVRGDIETAPIGDQVDALHAVAERAPGLLDLGRVAIRGWSWGGFLAAACVLRRPDVFQAAISGAAVLDQRLYHTYWKERQLGHPDEEPERYDWHSLPRFAHRLERPLLLIHGLADDNVLPAHTMRFSSALMAAGRTHELLLLAGHGHEATRQPISRYLLAYQLVFLRRALGLTGGYGDEASTSNSEETI